MEEDRPDIDYTEVFGNKYPEPTSTEKPIEIIGVGNRMGIKTGNGYTNEWGRNLDQEEVSMIKSNLQSPSIANPEYFGLQKPDEEEMQVFEEMQHTKITSRKHTLKAYLTHWITAEINFYMANKKQRTCGLGQVIILWPLNVK